MTNDQKEVHCHQGPEKCHYCKIVGLQEQVDQERANKVMLLQILHECNGFRLSPILHRRIHNADFINKRDTDAFIAEVQAGAVREYIERNGLNGNHSHKCVRCGMSYTPVSTNEDCPACGCTSVEALELRQSAAQPEKKDHERT